MGGVTALLQQLRDAGSVCLDTVIFIYAFERHPRFGPASQAVFGAIAVGEFQAYASVLAAGEVLTGVKKAGDDDLLVRYRDLFQRFPGLAWWTLTLRSWSTWLRFVLPVAVLPPMRSI